MLIDFNNFNTVYSNGKKIDRIMFQNQIVWDNYEKYKTVQRDKSIAVIIKKEDIGTSESNPNDYCFSIKTESEYYDTYAIDGKRVRTNNVGYTYHFDNNKESIVVQFYKNDSPIFTNVKKMSVKFMPDGYSNILLDEFEGKLDFSQCDLSKVTGFCLQTKGEYDISPFKNSKLESFRFYYNDILKSLDFSEFDFSKLRSMSCAFLGCHNLETVKFPSMANVLLDSATSTFSSCKSLKNADLSDWNFTNVVSTDNMFWDCTSLTSINLGSTVIKPKFADKMFSGCTSLTKLDLRNMDTSNITSANGVKDMFKNVTCPIIVSSKFTYTPSQCDYGGTFTVV